MADEKTPRTEPEQQVCSLCGGRGHEKVVPIQSIKKMGNEIHYEYEPCRNCGGTGQEERVR